jgi:hypothetical protein
MIRVTKVVTAFASESTYSPWTQEKQIEDEPLVNESWSSQWDGSYSPSDIALKSRKLPERDGNGLKTNKNIPGSSEGIRWRFLTKAS